MLLVLGIIFVVWALFGTAFRVVFLIAGLLLLFFAFGHHLNFGALRSELSRLSQSSPAAKAIGPNCTTYYNENRRITSIKLTDQQIETLQSLGRQKAQEVTRPTKATPSAEDYQSNYQEGSSQQDYPQSAGGSYSSSQQGYPGPAQYSGGYSASYTRIGGKVYQIKRRADNEHRSRLSQLGREHEVRRNADPRQNHHFSRGPAPQRQNFSRGPINRSPVHPGQARGNPGGHGGGHPSGGGGRHR